MDYNEFKYYTGAEMKKLILDNEKLVCVDNGNEEFFVKYSDLPDFIVDMNRSLVNDCELKVYKYPIETTTPILTTYGEFLNRCDPDVRKDIINRLVKVQTGEEETKNYKIMNNREFDRVLNEIEEDTKVKILDTWLTDFDDIRCKANVLIGGVKKVNIITSFDRYNYPDWKNSKEEYKEIIKEEWADHLHKPNISECSKLLQEIYDTVRESESTLCHIDYDDWAVGYANRYTKEDLDKLYDEIKKYELEDIVDLNDKEYILKDGYSTEEELKDYTPEYKIVGYGDLELVFNDDRDIIRNKEMER